MLAKTVTPALPTQQSYVSHFTENLNAYQKQMLLIIVGPNCGDSL